MKSVIDLRGHNLTLMVCRSKNIREESFTNRVVKPWDSLPLNEVSAPDINTFKKKPDKYWRN